MLRTTISHSRIPGQAAMALSLLFGLAIAVSAQAAAPSSYTVKKGDTLWGIARTQLGDPHRWQDLFRLNQSAVSDPHRMIPGTVLRLKAETPAPAPAAAAAAPAPSLAPPAPHAPPPAPIARTGADTLPPVSPRPSQGDPATALFRRRAQFDVVSIAARRTGGDGVDDRRVPGRRDRRDASPDLAWRRMDLRD